MQIQIIDVGTPNTHAAKNGRSYQSIEVTYKGADGKVGNKKLMSFSNPDVFKRISTLSKGNSIDVVTTKDDAGYWQWTGINDGAPSSDAPTPSQPSVGVSTRVTGNNYPTAEERLVTQTQIVRQSSLAQANATLGIGSKAVNPDDVLALAERYANWVVNKEPVTIAKLDGAISDIEDDIPY